MKKSVVVLRVFGVFLLTLVAVIILLKTVLSPVVVIRNVGFLIFYEGITKTGQQQLGIPYTFLVFTARLSALHILNLPSSTMFSIHNIKIFGFI